MKENPIQFAVVREDPLVEAEVIRSTGAERMLLIGSGGCKALTLQALFPKLEMTLVDPNPAQISLIKRKVEQLTNASQVARKQAFNIGSDDPMGLNACGNFESLFRCFRRFLNEFVLPDREMSELFNGKISTDEVSKLLFANKYWTPAFDLHFTNSFLEAMFGSAAVQHAPAGSYPTYFRRAFEAGLSAPSMQKNYFLHHVLLGRYRDEPDSLPHYLVAEVPQYHFNFVVKSADQVGDWGAFDVVDLSNIFDWMPESSVKDLASILAREMRTDSRLIFRQLNHAKDFSRLFSEEFRFDVALGERLLAVDRSLFYAQLNVATKL